MFVRSAVPLLTILFAAGCGSGPAKPRIASIEVDEGDEIKSTVFEYEPGSGRVASIVRTESDDPNDMESFFIAYDGDGSFETVTFEGSSAEQDHECVYDREDGRLVAETCTGALLRTRLFNYDEEDRLSTIDDGGDTTDLTYDEDGYLSRVRERGSFQIDSELSRSDDGLARITTKFGTTTVLTRYEYRSGRLTGIASDTSDWKFGYDSADRIKDIEVTDPDGNTTYVSFTYAAGDMEGDLIPTLPHSYGRYIALDGGTINAYLPLSAQDFYRD